MHAKRKKAVALLEDAKGPVSKAIGSCKATELPLKGEHFFCNNFPEFATRVRAARANVGNLLSRLGVDGAAAAAVDADGATQTDEDDDFYQGIVAALDDHLDRVDHNLDAAAAAGGGAMGKQCAAAATSAVALSSAGSVGKRVRVPFHVGTLARPQDSFDVPVDNTDADFHPPVPYGHRNPHSIRSQPGVHPLRDELEALEYPPWVAEAGGLTTPTPLEASEAVFVDSEAALAEMSEHLEGAREFAVDLEHHAYRSFQGFTCLMQVSTRERDYVVDTIALRSSLRDALAKHFLDPKKLKVFHGADMDVQWLQRDFGVYVVCMFDTGQAARVLELPSRGLAYLLSHYCGVKADKRYQLADWRLRPLTPEMIAYARGDTHHLLYVYDRLKQQLAAAGAGRGSDASAAGESNVTASKNLIREVLNRSRDVCLTLYSAPRTHPLSYHVDYLKNQAGGGCDLDMRQLAAYAALFSWRDKLSREADESVGYVLPRALLLRIARGVPTTARALLALARGEAPLVAKHSVEIVDVIGRAVAVGAPPALPPSAGEESAAADERGGGANASRSEVTTTTTTATTVTAGAAAVGTGAGVTTKAERPARGVAAAAPAAKRGGSAMASMMGGGGGSVEGGGGGGGLRRAPDAGESVAGIAPAAGGGGGGGSAMARMMAGPVHAPAPAATATATAATAAAAAAARVRSELVAGPVPLSALFPSWHATASVTPTSDTPGAAARKYSPSASAAAPTATVEPSSTTGGAAAAVNVGLGKLPGDYIDLPGGYKAPAPMRKGAGEKRRAERDEAEREAVVKARAEEARNTLAHRRRAVMRGMDDSDDSDDSDSEGGGGRGRSRGFDLEDEKALLSVGAGGFDFAAAAAAVLPGGKSFAALGATTAKKGGGYGQTVSGGGGRGGRGGRSGDGGRGGGRGGRGDGKGGGKGAKTKGEFDSNGRRIMIEPFKPAKKSKAHPRSGDRSSTFR